MPLTALWKSNPVAVGEFTNEQVVATAGDGNLKDGSVCSHELREYLGGIAADKIASYIEHCLSSSFGKGGMVLQDLVNELGRRLEYSVTNGRYQGTSTHIGFDGIWRSPEGHTIIAEVKTTDALSHFTRYNRWISRQASGERANYPPVIHPYCSWA
jgi:hypothetical protein